MDVSGLLGSMAQVAADKVPHWLAILSFLAGLGGFAGCYYMRRGFSKRVQGVDDRLEQMEETCREQSTKVCPGRFVEVKVLNGKLEAIQTSISAVHDQVARTQTQLDDLHSAVARAAFQKPEGARR